MISGNINVVSKTNRQPVIFFVDDEQKLCKEIDEILANEGFITHCFINAYNCLNHLKLKTCDLLIADYRLPKMSGIELMKEAKKQWPWLPVMIITGYADIPLAVLAIKEGAVDLIEKPLNTEFFLGKIKRILQPTSETHNLKINSLSIIQKIILSLVLKGKSNSEIAILLNRSKRTIENHRQRLMKKLGVHNIAQLMKSIYIIKS